MRARGGSALRRRVWELVWAWEAYFCVNPHSALRLAAKVPCMWRTRRMLASWGTAVGLVLVAASPAAATTFRDFKGSTSQEARVDFSTRNGVANVLHIYEWEAPCEVGSAYTEHEAIFQGGFDVATKRRLYEEARYRFYGPRTGPVEATIAMRRLTKRRWTGTFEASVRIQHDGQVIDRCATSFTFKVRRTKEPPFVVPRASAALDE